MSSIAIQLQKIYRDITVTPYCLALLRSLKYFIQLAVLFDHSLLCCYQEMNRPGEAVVHFQRAAELQMQTPIEALLSLGEMATCKILTREFILLLLQNITLKKHFTYNTLHSLHNFDVCLQVTMMVLCQCSLRCS